MKKCRAFTLAEVLITLGIIGIVAAMTMPSLIANYQKKVFVNQLKKSVSIWEQGFQKMLADNGVDSLVDTDVFSAITGTFCRASDGNISACNNFYEYLKKYYNIVDISPTGDYKYSNLPKEQAPFYPDNSRNGTKIVFSDGSMIIRYNFEKNAETPVYPCETIKNAGGKYCTIVGNITIDVNGFKNPNVVGRDLFNFNITGDGHLIPFYGIDQAVYLDGVLYGSSHWKNNIAACGTPGLPDATKVSTYGSGCAARIIENGWVMDY